MTADTERQVICEECGGDGGWDVPYDYDPRDGSQLTAWRACRTCNGDGWYMVEDEPMTMEDALQLDAEILRSQGVEVDDPEFFDGL